MDWNELKALILKHSHDELAKQEGHVYQVWEDGEVTSQKSGSLLWQRTLHCFDGGSGIKVDFKLFPHHDDETKVDYDKCHGYIFTDEIGAYTVRKAILEMNVKSLNVYIEMCDTYHIKRCLERIEEEKKQKELETSEKVC